MSVRLLLQQLGYFPAPLQVSAVTKKVFIIMLRDMHSQWNAQCNAKVMPWSTNFQ